MPLPDPAFSDWIGPHLPALRRLSRAFAEPADQPDLLQELLIAVWKAQGVFRGDSAPGTFIYRVAHNRALTWKRREGLRLARWFETRRDLALPIPADTDADRLEQVYDALRRLTPIDRSLMLLWLEQTPYAEIAALHGLSETHVGVRLTRSRARLAALIKDTPDGL